MRQINLLPPEVVERRRARQLTAALALGLAALIAVLFLVFVVQAGRLSGARGRLAAQERHNRALQAQVGQLSRFAAIQEELDNKSQILTALTSGEVRWSVVLADVATYIPSDVWLTSLTGSVQAAPAPATGAAAAASSFGSVQFAGCTLEPPDGTHLEVAKWLVRIGIPKEFLAPYLSVSSKGADACPVSFSSTVSLSDGALRTNQRGGERAQ